MTRYEGLGEHKFCIILGLKLTLSYNPELHELPPLHLCFYPWACPEGKGTMSVQCHGSQYLVCKCVFVCMCVCVCVQIRLSCKELSKYNCEVRRKQIVEESTLLQMVRQPKRSEQLLHRSCLLMLFVTCFFVYEHKWHEDTGNRVHACNSKFLFILCSAW